MGRKYRSLAASGWKERSSEISVLVLVLLAIALISPRLTGVVGWGADPDSFAYQTQMYELRGESQSAALHSAYSSIDATEVFGAAVHSHEYGSSVRTIESFFRRRWLVPAIAAALYPLAGAERSLLDASILGYVVLGPLLFALLRRRFTDGVSLAVTALCLWLPPLREWAGHPLTDSWGLALEVATLLAAILALERGGRWIAVLAASMLALSFTRDTTLVPLVGLAWVAVISRTRRSAAVFATGIAAAVPAVALFGAPLVRTVSWALAGFPLNVPSGSWSYVLSRYPGWLGHLIHLDAIYPGSLSFHLFWYAVGVAILGATGYMVIASPRRDPFYMLQRAGLIGAVAVTVLSAAWTDMRVELAFVPCVAAALAFTVSRVLAFGRVGSIGAVALAPTEPLIQAGATASPQAPRPGTSAFPDHPIVGP